MLKNTRNDALLASVRNGLPLSGNEKLQLIIGLSIPSILAQITSVLMFFIDASMVGHLGAEASASIGLVESTTWLFGSLTSAASMGFSVQVAHFIGANDFRQARQVLRQGLRVTLVFSVLLALAGIIVSGRLPYWLGGGVDIAGDASWYFRIFMFVLPVFQLNNLAGAMLKSSGDMRSPSVISVLMCVLDVAFNYFFIYILSLGVIGAAIGTALAVLIGGSAQSYILLFRNKFLALRLDKGQSVTSVSYLRQALGISSPIALQSVLMSGAQIVSTMIVAPLGNFAIAANTFAITAESLCYMPGYGIGDAATTLVGQSIGANRPDICRSFAWRAIALGMSVMAFMGVVMWIFAPEMIGVLSPVKEIRELGAGVLRIEAFAEPFFAASIVCYSICVGAGDTLRPAIMNLVSMWGVRLTLAFWLSQSYGLRGVWFAMATELTFRGCIFLVRIYRGKWLDHAKVSS
ncbi:MAG: MATE family efflux transporter [Prevotella sp.]